MKFSATTTVAAFAAAAQATNHVVTVAPGGSITYSPSSITAAVGDTIEFLFASNNHSVAQASFASPCQPMNGGIWSGFVLTTGSSAATTTKPQAVPGYKRQLSMPSFTVTVNDTNPAFFYCAQIGHCQAGMVFALNPSQNQTFDAFKSAAATVNTIVPNEAPQGGVLTTAGGNSPSPTAGSSTSSGNVNIFSWLNALVVLMGSIACALK